MTRQNDFCSQPQFQLPNGERMLVQTQKPKNLIHPPWTSSANQIYHKSKSSPEHFFCWVPGAHSFRVSLLLTIELRANSVNRFGTDIELTSLLCLRCFPLLPLCRCKTLDLVATPRRICAAAVKKFGEDSPDRCAELGLEGASEHFHIHQKWRHVTSTIIHVCVCNMYWSMMVYIFFNIYIYILRTCACT